MAQILLIEPDQILARIYTEALSRAGHTVRCAATAQVAIDKADTSTPDLVILELQLAEHNGVEFLYEFRSYSEWQQVPVIIHSIVPSDSSQAAWQQLGIAAYHYKPQTTLKTLLASVSQVASAKV